MTSDVIEEINMEPFIVSCLESRVENNGAIYGRFIVGPFDLGQGITIATALRRSLLSDINGIAITAVEIRGVEHEYSVLPGIRESVLDILLNLKQIVLNGEFFQHKSGVGYLEVRGPGRVKAIDLKLPPGIRCVNPNQSIAHLEYDGHLSMKFFISTGKNYVIHAHSTLKSLSPAIFLNNSENLMSQNPLFEVEKFSRHILPIDAIFMPVIKVNFLVEVDDHSQISKERIILEIWTNGSIHPRIAIHKASSSLIRLFALFRKSNSINFLSLKSPVYSIQERNLLKKLSFNLLKNDQLNDDKEYVSSISVEKSLRSIDIANLDLSIQTYASLKKVNIETLNDLLQYSSNDLLSIQNFSRDSLDEIEKNLYKLGFKLKPRDQ